jgi:hypothetical protein
VVYAVRLAQALGEASSLLLKAQVQDEEALMAEEINVLPAYYLNNNTIPPVPTMVLHVFCCGTMQACHEIPIAEVTTDRVASASAIVRRLYLDHCAEHRKEAK